MIWNVIPSAPYINTNLKFTFPYFGTCRERNIVSKYFNTILKEKLGKLNIYFLDIFDELIDNNHRTKSEYFFDCFHLSQKAMSLVLKKIFQKFPNLKAAND